MWLVMRSSRTWVTLEDARSGEVLVVRMKDGASLYGQGESAGAVKQTFGPLWVGLSAPAARRAPWESACVEFVPPGTAADPASLPEPACELLLLNRQVMDWPVPAWLVKQIMEASSNDQK